MNDRAIIKGLLRDLGKAWTHLDTKERNLLRRIETAYKINKGLTAQELQSLEALYNNRILQNNYIEEE